MMMKMGSKEKNTPMNFSEKAMKYMKDMPALYGKPRMDHGKPKMMNGGPGDGKKNKKKIIKEIYPNRKPVTNNNKKIITDYPSVQAKPKTKPDAFDKKLGDFMNKEIKSGDLDKLFKSAPNKPPKGARIKEMPGVYPMMYKNKKK